MEIEKHPPNLLISIDIKMVMRLLPMNPIQRNWKHSKAQIIRHNITEYHRHLLLLIILMKHTKMASNQRTSNHRHIKHEYIWPWTNTCSIFCERNPFDDEQITNNLKLCFLRFSFNRGRWIYSIFFTTSHSSHEQIQICVWSAANQIFDETQFIFLHTFTSHAITNQLTYSNQ